MADTKSRPLAPAPPGANAALDAQQRRKNVGTACAACKTRKLKVFWHMAHDVQSLPNILMSPVHRFRALCELRQEQS